MGSKLSAGRHQRSAWRAVVAVLLRSTESRITKQRPTLHRAESDATKPALHRSAATTAATLLALLYASTLHAATLVTSSVDGGGGRSTVGSYVNDGCVGGIAGVSTTVSPTEIARHGYIGQLTEVASLSVLANPTNMYQGATSQLAGTATMDDQTVTALTGSDVAWNPVAYPFQSVSSDGLLTAVANVYAEPIGNVYGSYLGTTSNAAIQVVGPYAGGGIPDSWYAQYFGSPPNPNAAPTVDADGDGQNNLFEYTAGVVPTNSASLFVLKIAPVPAQPGQQVLTWTPLATGRTYTPEYRLDLSAGTFSALGGYSGPQTNSGDVSVTDLNATEPVKFYRIHISLP